MIVDHGYRTECLRSNSYNQSLRLATNTAFQRMIFHWNLHLGGAVLCSKPRYSQSITLHSSTPSLGSPKSCVAMKVVPPVWLMELAQHLRTELTWSWANTLFILRTVLDSPSWQCHHQSTLPPASFHFLILFFRSPSLLCM